MTSSIFHKRCLHYVELAKGRIHQLQFTEAAFEIMRADRFAVHAVDMFDLEQMKEELETRHGVDWHEAQKKFKAMEATL